MVSKTTVGGPIPSAPARMVIFLAYIFYFIAASASPLQRRWLAVNREADNDGQIDFAFKVVFIVAFLGLIIPFFQPIELTGNYLSIGLLALVCGLFGAGFYVTYFIAQKHVDAGITTLVSNIYTPVTIILASVFLNERLTLMQIIGTLLLLFAIVLISKKHRQGKLRFDKHFLMMFAGGVMLGVLLTAERSLQKITGFTAGTLLSWWSQSIVLGIAVLIMKDKTRHTTKDTLITGVLRFFQSLSWVILIFIVSNLSVVSAVTTFKVVVIFAAAALFLNEREDLPRKIFGSFIAVVGLLLMK